MRTGSSKKSSARCPSSSWVSAAITLNRPNHGSVARRFINNNAPVSLSSEAEVLLQRKPADAVAVGSLFSFVSVHP